MHMPAPVDALVVPPPVGEPEPDEPPLDEPPLDEPPEPTADALAEELPPAPTEALVARASLSSPPSHARSKTPQKPRGASRSTLVTSERWDIGARPWWRPGPPAFRRATDPIGAFGCRAP